MVLEMLSRRIHVVANKRTAIASFFPPWPIHKVVHNELAAAVEKIGQTYQSIVAFEDVIGFHFNPWEFAARGAYRIASFGEFFLLLKERACCRDPLVLRYDLMLGRRFGGHLSFPY